jgi:fumarylacetoacetase
MALEPYHWSALRVQLSRLLRSDTPEGERAYKLRGEILFESRQVELTLPAVVGDYTDFYASRHHAMNVGRMLRPENPLLPNYTWVPVGYHGRSSSIVPSGTPVRRPWGQLRSGISGAPTYAPTERLDYEAEVGFFVGTGNSLGDSIPIVEAERHLFGVCLLNDWSARDIQAWEYQPLGPFLAKNFATTISPWVVSFEALAPFRVAPAPRESGDPEPLPYLAPPDDATPGSIDLAIEVHLRTATMRAAGTTPARLSRACLRDLYWTPAQLLAHHSSNGCPMRPGDLLGSGTISGADREERGCLLELTWRGTEPVRLPNGEERRFLEDGDEVILRAACRREGFATIGFGDCSGMVLPAHHVIQSPDRN